MSYLTAFKGAIKISPPLPWLFVKDSPFRPHSQYNKALLLDLDEEDNGIRCAIGVVIFDDDYAHDDQPDIGSTYAEPPRLTQELQELVDAYPNHEFSGYISCQGSEADDPEEPDIWRLRVVNRRAIADVPQMVWSA
jgi:hypothetical protein